MDPAPINIPGEGISLEWVAQNADELTRAIRKLNALSALEVVVIISGKQYKYPIQFGDANSTITIPIS